MTGLKRDATLYAAANYFPHDRVMLFAEINGDNHSAGTRAAGMRYWLVPEVFGLDVTASRTNATPTAQLGAWVLAGTACTFKPWREICRITA